MERTITVKGVGKVSASPDTIEISITISAIDKDYKTAVDSANRKLQALRSALKEVGFDTKQFKTEWFDVHAEYQYQNNEKVFTGYSVNHALKLEFGMDKELLARTIDALSISDSDTDFNINFTVKDKETLTAQLIRSAAENARKNALILCEASGVTLGALQKINYIGSKLNICSPTAYSNGGRLRGISNEASADINPENISLNDSAEFVWEIS